MKVISRVTDEHVTQGLTYEVVFQPEKHHVIVRDNELELWDLLDNEFEVVEK